MRLSSWKNAIFSVSQRGHLQGSQHASISCCGFTPSRLIYQLLELLHFLSCWIFGPRFNTCVSSLWRLTIGLRFSTRWMPTMPRNAPKLSCKHKGAGNDLKNRNLEGRRREAPATHDDAGVISGHGHVVGAGGGDQTDGQDQQRQSQQGHGDPQGRSPATQVLNWGRGRRQELEPSHKSESKIKLWSHLGLRWHKGNWKSAQNHGQVTCPEFIPVRLLWIYSPNV